MTGFAEIEWRKIKETGVNVNKNSVYMPLYTIFQMSLYKWFTPQHNSTDSVKSTHTQDSIVCSSKSEGIHRSKQRRQLLDCTECNKRNNYDTQLIHRQPSIVSLNKTIPETRTSYIANINTEIQTPSGKPHTSINIFFWLFRTVREYVCKSHMRVSIDNSIEDDEEERVIENRSEIWKNKESMSDYIISLSNRYKNNRELYKITNQIRNCIPLSSEDVDNIMHFNKNETLTIILLQNYCLDHHRENIELLMKESLEQIT